MRILTLTINVPDDDDVETVTDSVNAVLQGLVDDGRLDDDNDDAWGWAEPVR